MVSVSERFEFLAKSSSYNLTNLHNILLDYNTTSPQASSYFATPQPQLTFNILQFQSPQSQGPQNPSAFQQPTPVVPTRKMSLGTHEPQWAKPPPSDDKSQRKCKTCATIARLNDYDYKCLPNFDERTFWICNLCEGNVFCNRCKIDNLAIHRDSARSQWDLNTKVPPNGNSSWRDYFLGTASEKKK